MRVHMVVDTERGDFEVTMDTPDYDEITFAGATPDRSAELAALLARASSAAQSAYAGAK